MTHEMEEEDFRPRVRLLAAKADALRKQGSYGEAEALYRTALDLVDEAVGHDHLEAANLYRKLGELEHARGRAAEAEALARWGLRIRERELGPDHPDVAVDKAVLAAILDCQGRRAEAEELYQQALGMLQRTSALPDHLRRRAALSQSAPTARKGRR